MKARTLVLAFLGLFLGVILGVTPVNNVMGAEVTVSVTISSDKSTVTVTKDGVDTIYKQINVIPMDTADGQDVVSVTVYEAGDSPLKLVAIFSHRPESRPWVVVIEEIIPDRGDGLPDVFIICLEDFDCDGEWEEADLTGLGIAIPDCARVD